MKNVSSLKTHVSRSRQVALLGAGLLALSFAVNPAMAEQPSTKSSMFSFFKSKPAPTPLAHLNGNVQFTKVAGVPTANELTREELLKSGEGTFKVTLTAQGVLEKIESGGSSFQGQGYALPAQGDHSHWIASFVEPGDPRTMFVAKQSKSSPNKTEVAQPINFKVQTTKNAGSAETLPHMITEVGRINENIALVRIAQHMNEWQSGLYTLDLNSLETQTIQNDGITSSASKPGIARRWATCAVFCGKGQ